MSRKHGRTKSVLFAVLSVAMIVGSAVGAMEAIDPSVEKPLNGARGNEHGIRSAYAGVTYLSKEIGLTSGMRKDAFSGRESRSRSEFASAVRTMYDDLAQIINLTGIYGVDLVDASPEGVTSVLEPRGPGDLVCQRLWEEKTLRAVIEALQSLVGEFQTELEASGGHVPTIERNLARWLERSKDISPWLQGARVFDDVPQGHWAYDSWSKACRCMGSSIYDDFWDQTYKGKRALTRYEFAVYVQRLEKDLTNLSRAGFRERLSLLDVAVGGKQAELTGKMPAIETRTPLLSAVRALSQEKNLRTALDETERLYAEFSVELKLLSSDVPADLEHQQVMRAHSGTISQGFRDISNRIPEVPRAKSKCCN
jgi:hypothetical protein